MKTLDAYIIQSIIERLQASVICLISDPSQFLHFMETQLPSHPPPTPLPLPFVTSLKEIFNFVFDSLHKVTNLIMKDWNRGNHRLTWACLE